MRGYHHHLQSICLGKLLLYAVRGSGHAAEPGVKREEGLIAGLGQRCVFGTDCDAFFGLQRLVKSVGESFVG